MIEIPANGTYGARIPARRIVLALIGLQTRAYRLLGGRGMGRHTVLLTTMGSRTGRERTAPIAGFPDGPGRWIVVASAAGSAHHPTWFLNLARKPEAVRLQVGRDRFAVTPEVVAASERAEVWQRIVTAAPGFAGYPGKTDREIPLVRLIRRAG